MELGLVRWSLICLLAVTVCGAEESTEPPSNAEQQPSSNLKEVEHGPLMKALLTPGENSSSESPELQRDKRHSTGYGQRGTWKKKKGGGCYSGCGGTYVPAKVIVVPVVVSKGKGGGCGKKGCGGHYQQPQTCYRCGGGGGSFSSAQASAQSFSWGGKK